MSRPDNIRCDGCVFWMDAQIKEWSGGNCHLVPHILSKARDEFCGLWRDTWPTTGVAFPMLPTGVVKAMPQNG